MYRKPGGAKNSAGFSMCVARRIGNEFGVKWGIASKQKRAVRPTVPDSQRTLLGGFRSQGRVVFASQISTLSMTALYFTKV